MYSRRLHCWRYYGEKGSVGVVSYNSCYHGSLGLGKRESSRWFPISASGSLVLVFSRVELHHCALYICMMIEAITAPI